MSAIESMLTGETSMAGFILQLKNGEELHSELNELVPKDAFFHPEHYY